MSRLQSIERKLLELNGAIFQNVCDAYLAMRENDLVSYNRIGSQLGKEKTTTGTPDSLFHLANGKLSFSERSSTNFFADVSR